VSRGFVGIS